MKQKINTFKRLQEGKIHIMTVVKQERTSKFPEKIIRINVLSIINLIINDPRFPINNTHKQIMLESRVQYVCCIKELNSTPVVNIGLG